jgi:hypothetical protein
MERKLLRLGGKIMLKDKYALFTKDDRVETVIKILMLNESPFIKDVKIYKNPLENKFKAKLTDMLGGTKTYNIEITLIAPVPENYIYVVELTSTEAEAK